MVMDLMEGGELFELVRSKRRFTEKEALNFTKQVQCFIVFLKLTTLYIVFVEILYIFKVTP